MSQHSSSGGGGGGRGGGGGGGRGSVRSGVCQPAFDFYVVLDFEATCSDDRREVPPHLQEIIEFPSVLVDARARPPRVVSELQVYVRPQAIPRLTPFCTQLTGITQAVVDAGATFEDAMRRHLAWLRANGLDPARPHNFAVVTCGDWDLKSMLPRQIALLQKQRRGSGGGGGGGDGAGGSGGGGGAAVPTRAPECYCSWANVKHVFEQFYGGRAGGMPSMLKSLRLPLEGRHHSGIDDCRNIANILIRLLEDGSPVRFTTTSPMRPPPASASAGASAGAGAGASAGTAARQPEPPPAGCASAGGGAAASSAHGAAGPSRSGSAWGPTPAASAAAAATASGDGGGPGRAVAAAPAAAAAAAAAKAAAVSAVANAAALPSEANLAAICEAQRHGAGACSSYATALQEIRDGKKKSHWMW